MLQLRRILLGMLWLNQQLYLYLEYILHIHSLNFCLKYTKKAFLFLQFESLHHSIFLVLHLIFLEFLFEHLQAFVHFLQSLFQNFLIFAHCSLQFCMCLFWFVQVSFSGFPALFHSRLLCFLPLRVPAFLALFENLQNLQSDLNFLPLFPGLKEHFLFEKFLH